MKTYTEHKLTDAMLKRLSQMVSGRPHNCGTSLDALITRGLVEPVIDPVDPDKHRYGRTHRATAEGEAALKEARRQGW